MPISYMPPICLYAYAYAHAHAYMYANMHAHELRVLHLASAAKVPKAAVLINEGLSLIMDIICMCIYYRVATHDGAE